MKATCWKGPIGKRKVGRPTKPWDYDVIKEVGHDWMALASCRELWKKKEEAFTQTGTPSQNDNLPNNQ